MSDRQRVLVVEDDEDIGVVLTGLLGRGGLEARHVASAEAAVTALDSGSFDAVLTDLKLPGMDGLALLRHVHERWSDVPVVMLTAFGSVPVAVEAMRAGAADFMLKPFDREEVLHTVQRALHAYAARAERPPEPVGLVGRSEPLRAVRADLLRAARVQSTVLIRGESGTGKEVVAKAIHAASARAEQPFVPVHCAAIPENLLEAELFGHVKGAFTGAVRDKPGRVELAEGGTLFLDELGDVPLAMQVKLLRLLQERAYEPVGDGRTKRADVRFVAATHRDLEAMVADGTFREDLFYRLNVIPLWLPALRDMKDDIDELATTLLGRIAPENGRAELKFAPEALARLGAYDFPGNVRELENVVERLTVFTEGERILEADVERELSRRGPRSPSPAAAPTSECEALRDALRRAGGNRTRAARLLGLSRRTIYNHMHRCGLLDE